MKYPFVESSENRLRIGKIVAREGGKAVVEYFRSPAESRPDRLSVAFSSLKQVFLSNQARVYWKDPKGFSWQVGRVLDYQKDDGCYLVRFPNEESRLIPSDELQVRCNLPISEPTELLAYQLNETAFWHAPRSEFVRHLLEQHRDSGELAALVSSSVEIVAHQAAAINRVLQDPFQRYLLADEVGLGKTIEAGVLIKQFAIDQPQDHETLVIVPDALIVQWQQELAHRFHLGSLVDKSIRILGSKNLSAHKQYVDSARMIVIDEAHHLSAWAWSTIRNERETYELVSQATSDLSRRILLLSATPVLRNEKSFLAMLHLLDPQVYPLDNLELFKERVRLRQEIAECLLSFSESESNYFLRDSLEQLGDHLTEDATFQSLRAELSALIENDVDEDDQNRNSLIRLIRSHVSDMWRLHRRILRSRRNDRTSVYLPGRGGAISINCVCENEARLAEALDSWRLCISAACFSRPDEDKQSASTLARTAEEFAATEPSMLIQWASDRMRIGSAEAFNTSIYDGEIDHLQRIIRAAKQCDHSVKLNKLLEVIRSSDDNSSFVVFADSSTTANRIYSFLETRLPQGKTLRHSCLDQRWSQFKSIHRGYVLVCDHEAEEGLNLQKRGAIAIHFDLPFSPNRIEQRMGRLDRFGQGSKMQTYVLLNDVPIQKGWFDLLESALGVFHRSIATLQYVVEDSLRLVWQEFLHAGADSFIDATERLKGEDGVVAAEYKRIRAQDDIDASEGEHFSQQMADELEASDRKLSRELPKVFSKWLCHSLNFQHTGEESSSDDVFSFQFCRRVDTGHRPRGHDTLIPQSEFVDRFAHSIENVPTELPIRFVTVPFTFDRVVSQQRSTRLLRVGDPFVDALEEFTKFDDRGVCFAFWRYCSTYKPVDDPDLFFRFDYVVSPNPIPIQELCDKHTGAIANSLLRRSRSILKPQFTTIWVDSNLDRVIPKDVDFGTLLKTPFSKTRHAWGNDYNLNSDRWRVAGTVCDMSLWRDLCQAARRKSELILREQSKLPELTTKCIQAATELAQQVEQQYQSRLTIARGNVAESLQRELGFEREFLRAQIEALSHPELRVDSVGAVFLSKQNPFVHEDHRRRREEDE
jgi:ATP-dependent helicase HepA